MKISRPDLSFDYKKIAAIVGRQILKYRFILTMVVIFAVFAFAILRVNSLADPESNRDRFLEQIQTLTVVQFDDNAVKAIQELEDSSVDVNPELIDDRDNPFSE